VLGLAALVLAAGGLLGQAATADTPEVPRIESVRMTAAQPQDTSASTIWYDDFSTDKTYTEKQNDRDLSSGFGGRGGSMICEYPKGSQGTGNRKVFFGDSPFGVMARAGEHFDEVYWRIYVYHQYGWTGGGPAKMSRITSMVDPGWAQAMIDHVWSSGETLTLDPVSCVEGITVRSTTYNDWNAMKWLGNRPTAQMPISSTEESGWWVCVEARCKLNTPGQVDGETQLWIDGKLEAERKKMNFRGSYTAHTLNALFLEAYWNDGSPVNQYRWYDNFVISTRPVGPVTTTVNPTLFKRTYHGPGKQAAWEVELTSTSQGTAVWRGSVQGTVDTLRVSAAAGEFLGTLAGHTALEAGTRYWARVRQQSTSGTWSEWSRWHQPFITEGEVVQGSLDCDWNGDGRASLLDVLAFILFRRNHPSDPAADYDGDGALTAQDPVRMLRDIIAGRCGIPSLASADEMRILDAGALFSSADREYILGALDQMRLSGNERELLVAALDEAGRTALPSAFALAQNYPNPFNPQTTIPFSLPESQAPVRVTLKVYDLRNRLVRTLIDGFREAGNYSVFWDGADEEGRKAPSGVYLYRLQAGENNVTRKMVLMR